MKLPLLCTCLAAFAAQAVPLTNLTWSLSRFARIEGTLLTVDVPPDKAGEGGCGRACVDLSAFSDKCFQAEIVARGENISKPRDSWNGLKFMFHYKNPETGSEQWPNTRPRLGSFPTQTITVSDSQHGRKLGRAELTLGLQDSSGKVVFDLSTLRIDQEEDLYPVTNQDYRVSYPAHVRNLPRLRGVMLPSGPCKEDDFRTLREWGATLARYQMVRNWHAQNSDQDVGEYMKWLDGKLDHLERDVLPWAAKYGIRIVVDLHVPPGGRDGGEMNMFHSQTYNDAFVEAWRTIAKRLKGRPGIYGYDLINEPEQRRRALVDYWTTQKRAAEAVRAIDPDTTIIIESNGWDSADTFAYLSPLAMDNVIYQVHMYHPHEYTHQGVHRNDGGFPKFVYPNTAKGWNRDYIRKRLAPVRAFEKRHGAKIYVGEFSAITWAEGAGQYIADCIAVFEEYGWDWTYHAFREWQGWSVEHEVDGVRGKFKPSADNPRRKALLDGLARPARAKPEG